MFEFQEVLKVSTQNLFDYKIAKNYLGVLDKHWFEIFCFGILAEEQLQSKNLLLVFPSITQYIQSVLTFQVFFSVGWGKNTYAVVMISKGICNIESRSR